MSGRKNTSSEMHKTIIMNEDTQKVVQSTSTLFERKAKLGVLKEVMSSPHKRKSFADNEKGYERFLSYHTSTHSAVGDTRSMHKSPTYRSTVNLNHEETSA